MISPSVAKSIKEAETPDLAPKTEKAPAPKPAIKASTPSTYSSTAQPDTATTTE